MLKIKSQTHFSSIAVVKRVFDHQGFENLNGDLPDLSILLKSTPNLPQQQAHQEVVSTEVISQRVVQLEIYSEHQATERRVQLNIRHTTEQASVLHILLTLKPLNPAFSKGHWQIEGNIVFMVANYSQEFKLELIQCLKGTQKKTHYREELLLPYFQ